MTDLESGLKPDQPPSAPLGDVSFEQSPVSDISSHDFEKTDSDANFERTEQGANFEKTDPDANRQSVIVDWDGPDDPEKPTNL